jgi:hypothetical protein
MRALWRLFGSTKLRLSLVILAMLAVSGVVVAAQKRTAFLCAAQGPFGLRVDGLCHSADDYGPGLVVNGQMEKMLNSSLYNSAEEDFLGARVIADVDAADADQGPWLTQDTGTAGCPIIVADADDGVYAFLLDNGNEVGDCTLYWGDEQNIDSDTEPFCIFRVAVQATPAAADTLTWGLTSAYNALIESTANNALFMVTGADLGLDVTSDDATTDTGVDTTGVTLTAATFYEFMVSANSMHGVTTTDAAGCGPNGCSPTNVGFFYRSTLGGAWTQLNPTVTYSIGADIALQPMVQIEKTSGTSTPSLRVERVGCYWKRT